MKSPLLLERLLYEIRWWRWFLFTNGWPMRTLYGGAYRLDKESRRLIIERAEQAKDACEPAFRGRYIKRVGHPFQPKHYARDVARELADGLRDGTVKLRQEDSQ